MNGIAKDVKILDLVNEIPNLKEKGDISDVLEEYGEQKTLEIIEKLKAKNYESPTLPISNTEDFEKENFEFTPFDIKTLSKKELLDKPIFKYLLSIEDEFDREKIIIQLEEKAKEEKCLAEFKSILKRYRKNFNTINEKLKHNDVAEMLLNKHSIAVYGNTLYIYINGVYTEDKTSIEKEIIKIIPDSTTHFRKEVYETLFLMARETTLNKEDGIINFKNGLFNIYDKTFSKHNPEIFSINQINTNFNNNPKRVDAVDTFLNNISCFKDNRKQAILEMLGYSMTTSTKLEKCFILYGETAKNGKSTFTKIATHLIGRNNTGNVSFKDINKHRFANINIKGKILNVGGEMPSCYIDDISALKLLITGELLQVEEKGKPLETISPYAKFIFNANQLPIVADKTNGFYRRLHIIPFEKVFSDSESKNFNINELLTPDALEYLANISLNAFLSMGEHFSNYEESEKEVNKYKISSNSTLSFINDKEYIKNFFPNSIPYYAIEVHNCYVNYCENNNWKHLGRNKFYDEIEKYGVIEVRTINNQKAYKFLDCSTDSR